MGVAAHPALAGRILIFGNSGSGKTTMARWVRSFEMREDEHSLSRFRALFDAFSGPQGEWRPTY